MLVCFIWGFRKPFLGVWSRPYIVTMPLNLLSVGELCAFVPLLSCLDVKELPSPALVFLMHLGFSKPLMHKSFSFVLHELFSAVESDGLLFQR